MFFLWRLQEFRTPKGLKNSHIRKDLWEIFPEVFSHIADYQRYNETVRLNIT